jgi:uncharacterized protein YjiK
MNRLLSRIPVFTLCLLLMSCSGVKKGANRFGDYDLASYKKVFLPYVLNEISGIYIDGNTIFAVQDERGIVFQLNKKGKILKEIPFSKRGDYEDIVMVDDQYFILRSDGRIVTFNKEEDVSSIKSLPKGEFEAIFREYNSERLNVLCKKCKKEASDYSIKAYSFDLNDLEKKPKSFKINLPKEKHFKEAFRPSAAAQNPITNDIYIISSIRGQLLVFDESYSFQEAIKLQKNLFPQPEGIAFDSKGNLYISNEGGEYTKPNLILFARVN